MPPHHSLKAQIIGVAGAISTAAVATTAAITELNNTQSDAVGAVSDAVAELRAEVAELKGLNAKLIAAVVAAGAATGPGPRDDDDAGGSNTFVPEITAADGRLNFAVKQGGRVTVNGEVLLPARCTFFDRNLHSRMPLVPTPASLKRAGV